MVGLPGDTVKVDDGIISVNGLPLDLADAGDACNDGDDSARGNGSSVPIAVPDHHVYVLGDNRGGSRDSRDFGCIHAANIMGRVDYITFPAGSWTRFGLLGR